MTLRLGWFTSARGAGSRAMFEAVAAAIADGTLDARFAAVFCNRGPGEDPATDEFFARVQAAGAPLLTRSSVAFRHAAGGARSRAGELLPAWRIEYDRAVEDVLEGHEFDLGVLAGYMLIFEREFTERHALLNLHPALPGGPTGTWREVIRHLIRTRATESGVMLHLAIPEVDMGPIVAYCRYPLRTPPLDREWDTLEARIDALDDTALDASGLFAAIRAAGMVRESPLLIATLRKFAARHLHVNASRVLDASGRPVPPTDLTREVNALVASTSGSAW